MHTCVLDHKDRYTNQMKMFVFTNSLYLFYFKGVSGRRLTRVFVVIGGILVCTVPQLIPTASNNLLQRATHHHLGYSNHDNDTERKTTGDNKTWYQHAFWVLIYASGHVAVVMMTITMEKLINCRERVSEFSSCKTNSINLSGNKTVLLRETARGVLPVA